MVYGDQTPIFHTFLTERQSSLPSLTRSKSPLGNGRSFSRTRDRKGKARDEDGDDFLKEAYRVHAHLSALANHLSQIRKAYLSLSTPPPLSRRQPRPGNTNDDEVMSRWEGSKYLTDRERDEIDLRARMILRRCRERVASLEDAEKGDTAVSVVSPKADDISARQKAQPATSSTLFTLLPSLAPSSWSANKLDESLLSAHRASVIWTLNDLLAKSSMAMSGLQEERAKRREERTKTLGGGAAREAAQLDARITSSEGKVVNGVIPDDEPPIESQLSAEQIQQFALENNALLEHMETQLSSVLAAEKSLLEISTLQTELVRHLVTQTEMTDRLYDEAVGSVGEVGKANEQLRKARRRGEEGRLFLLVFLIGASVALLFLNWYA